VGKKIEGKKGKRKKKERGQRNRECHRQLTHGTCQINRLPADLTRPGPNQDVTEGGEKKKEKKKKKRKE